MVVALREPPQTNEARRRFGSCHVTRPQGSEAASASVADEVLAWCVLSTDDRETMVAL